MDVIIIFPINGVHARDRIEKKTISIIQILKFCWYVIFIVSYLCTLNTLMLSKFSGKIFRHLKVRFSIYMYHFSKK